jgi:drug/metabolite transporter (DMT)-like permease
VLFSALSVGLVFVLVRMLAKTEKVLTIIHYFMLCCIIFSLCFLQFWRWPTGQEWIWVSSIGVLGLIGQVYMTMAFKHSEATLLAPFKYMELIYAVIIGYFFLQEKYNIYAIGAMALIILGMIMNVLVKRKQQ